MTDFLVAAKTSEISEGEGKIISINGKEIAIFNVKNEFFAIDNACCHHGGPLGEGILDGAIITCPWHHWKYNVMTGVNPINPQIRVQTYEVKVENDEIKIRV